MKVVVSDPETGKSYQKELDKDQVKAINGAKLGEVLKGDNIGLNGYELIITGGSDKNGFPMRPDLHGSTKKKLLLSTNPGFKPKRKGERRRKTVRGNTIADDIAQINTKVIKKGPKSLDELMPKEKKE